MRPCTCLIYIEFILWLPNLARVFDPGPTAILAQALSPDHSRSLALLCPLRLRSFACGFFACCPPLAVLGAMEPRAAIVAGLQDLESAMIWAGVPESLRTGILDGLGNPSSFLEVSGTP